MAQYFLLFISQCWLVVVKCSQEVVCKTHSGKLNFPFSQLFSLSVNMVMQCMLKSVDVCIYADKFKKLLPHMHCYVCMYTSVLLAVCAYVGVGV